MGILGIDIDSDIIAHIRDLYDIEVGISRSRLYWPSIDGSGADGGTIGCYISNFIGREPLIGRMTDVIERSLLTATIELFKRKYDNGLEKKFSITWQKISNGYVVRSIDDQRNTHIKLILKNKSKTNDFLQTAKSKIKKFLRFS